MKSLCEDLLLVNDNDKYQKISCKLSQTTKSVQDFRERAKVRLYDGKESPKLICEKMNLDLDLKPPNFEKILPNLGDNQTNNQIFNQSININNSNISSEQNNTVNIRVENYQANSSFAASLNNNENKNNFKKEISMNNKNHSKKKENNFTNKSQNKTTNKNLSNDSNYNYDLETQNFLEKYKNQVRKELIERFKDKDFPNMPKKIPNEINDFKPKKGFISG